MDSNLAIIGIALLVALSFAGAGYAVLGPRIAERDRVRKRVEAVAGGKGKRKEVSASGGGPRASRRNVQQTLKEIEDAQKGQKQRLTLRQMIVHAGLELSLQNFIIGSTALGVVVLVALMLGGYPPLICAGFGFAAGFGVPRWLLGFLARRRQKLFSEQFVNGVDVVVRGVKAGLPVGECMGIIARESPDPLGLEFRTLVEGQKLGVSLTQGLQRMLERMPSTELNFFVIVLTIQQQTGGNLSEALSNLSAVLRARKQMRAKIQAMSSEAKASAMIIGALPFLVTTLIYATSPDYIELLFTTRMGNFLIMGGLLWMSMGVFIMRKMINFDF